ncbi:hypothetical protein HOLleu_10286 [Holothuria leucospilota]|uniref:Uncharacterized protein n=1 Tax=Holothuria leucospilota TaxID=206669 RepID=A0A9Q1CEM1_HOLLE|nr:hypothetical protein HOLleu_10286 [Holothuria leucospilota]
MWRKEGAGKAPPPLDLCLVITLRCQSVLFVFKQKTCNASIHERMGLWMYAQNNGINYWLKDCFCALVKTDIINSCL